MTYTHFKFEVDGDGNGEAERGGLVAKAGEGPTRLLEDDQLGVGGRGHVGSVGES